MPGKLILGGFATQPPSQDDDFCAQDYEFSSFIDQLDGNVSIISSSSDSDGPPLNISVQIGHRPNSQVINSRLPHARRVIRRDNKVLQAVSLPKLL